jgi:DNA-directed RNA polymerase
MEMEKASVALGIRRYERLVSDPRQSARDPVGADFLRRTVRKLGDAIHTEQEEICDSRVRRTILDPDLLLLSLDSDKLAFIALQTAFEKIARNTSVLGAPTLTELAIEIGHRCCWQRRYEEREGKPRDVAARLLRAGRNQTANAKSKARRHADVVNEDWSIEDRSTHLGLALVDLLVATEGMFSLTKVHRQGQSYRVLQLTNRGQEWLESRDRDHRLVAPPVLQPMVHPPKLWSSLAMGGYLTNGSEAGLMLPLVKHRNAARITNALAQSDLSRVHEAVNALQGTPWRINRDVYKTMQRAWKAGLNLPGLPNRDTLSRVRHQLADLQQTRPQRNAPTDSWKTYNRSARPLYQERDGLLSDITAFKMRMSTARDFLAADRFWVPWQLDYRGRLYPLPALNMQLADSGRALLEFADGKLLTQRGRRWLMIHMANLAGIDGIDKKPFDDRVRWVERNQADIASFATNPLQVDHRFWREDVDKPWCLLAACGEWLKSRAGTDVGFHSHVPVALDGTCNGLQHLSAMALDRSGGEATNLVPSERPQDIYADVAVILTARLRREADHMNGHAAWWLDVITSGRVTPRRLVKHATMCLPYGITPSGVRDDLMEQDWMREIGDEWIERDEKARYLATVLLECIGERVKAAPAISRWLEEISDVLAAHDLGFQWMTPAGLPVVVEHRAKHVRRITTKRFGRTVSLTLHVEWEDYKPSGRGRIRRRLGEKEGRTLRGAVLPERQRRTIVPNLVHSYDAAHLVAVIRRLYESGLRDFAVVHDSYAVHADAVDSMAAAIREEFVSIYREPVLKNFLSEQIERGRSRLGQEGVDALGQLMQRIPVVGDLNLAEVRSSEYMFS